MLHIIGKAMGEAAAVRYAVGIAVNSIGINPDTIDRHGDNDEWRTPHDPTLCLRWLNPAGAISGYAYGSCRVLMPFIIILFTAATSPIA